ncbi:MAG: hypothetical protein REI64_01970 [Pedobacter sp.]|uniref:hypothetical protein n=1 Tax=Pedobacter sp. TaxID=1411316 RepID=UPI00280728D6|nr:hypothetical protein [Pedobacter sp.]MDQ8003534.1 hypothetical protein [Pedobacter sp.]
MEIQFEQNKNFNQSHRDEPSVENTREGEKGQPQGREGDPNIRMANREALESDRPELDRRPADVAQGNASDIGDEKSSAVAGVRSEQQDSSEGESKPTGEDPNYNDRKNNEDKEEQDDSE